MQLRAQRRSPAFGAGLASLVAVLLMAAVVVAVAVAIAVGPAAVYESLRGWAIPDEASVAAAPPLPATIAPPPQETSPASPPAVVPAASAPAASIAQSTPAVAVGSLPKATVEPDMTRVTLPRSAKGHRIFVDGRVVGNGAAPLTIKCGTRKIKIGSGGKLQVRVLPCGGELALD